MDNTITIGYDDRITGLGSEVSVSGQEYTLEEIAWFKHVYIEISSITRTFPNTSLLWDYLPKSSGEEIVVDEMNRSILEKIEAFAFMEFGNSVDEGFAETVGHDRSVMGDEYFYAFEYHITQKMFRFWKKSGYLFIDAETNQIINSPIQDVW